MNQKNFILSTLFNVLILSISLNAQQLSGTLPADTTLTANFSPWEITGDLVVPSGITLTIDAGCTIHFNNDTGIEIKSGGRIVAVGEENNHITMTRRPTTSDRWNGIGLNGTTEENILSFIDMQHGNNKRQIIDIHRARVVLDHLTWDSSNRIIVEVYHPSAIIQNCIFPSVDEVEVIHGEYLEDDEYLILIGNTFGPPLGYNDVIDFTDCKRPGPILEVYGNTFLGGGDDGLDLDGVDAYIEGNTFMHFHKDHTGSSTSNAIATGLRNGKTSDIVVVRNIFFDNDHAVLLKEDCFMHAENNTFVKSDSGIINFSEWPYRNVAPGKGADLKGNIFWDYKRAFENQFSQPGKPDPVITVQHSIIDSSLHYLGTNNMDADPDFVDEHSNFHLLPTSPAIGAGPNGLDMGAFVPAGASISGEPAGTTLETTATLTIGGPSVTHYQYVMNDPNNSWSEERSLIEHPTIYLENLAVGQSYTLFVRGKTDSTRWQENPSYAISKTWFVYDPNVHVDAAANSNPHHYELYDAFPNPFNASTLIRFDLPIEQKVAIDIYDALGRFVESVNNKILSAGSHRIKVETHEWPSGVYFYRMTAGDFQQSKRFILLR